MEVQATCSRYFADIYLGVHTKQRKAWVKKTSVQVKTSTEHMPHIISERCSNDSLPGGNSNVAHLIYLFSCTYNLSEP
jgi:hypothetical protein